MQADSDARARPPDWAATQPGSPCLVVPHASPSNTASFLDNHIARNPHSTAIWKTATQHRRSLAIRENSRTHLSRRGRGRACTFVRLRECGWEDLRDGCAALLVFRVGSARTLMRKDAPPTVGARRRTPHRGRHTPWRSHPCRIDLSLRKKSKRSLVRHHAARSAPYQPDEQHCARGQWVSGSPYWWLWQLLVPTRWAQASAHGTIAPAPRQHPPCTQHPCRQHRVNLRCQAATRSAPTESSCAPPSSQQTHTQNRSCPKKPKKTQNEEQKQPQNTTSRS